jgi:hypothetical protein
VKLRKRVYENGQLSARTDYTGSWVYEGSNNQPAALAFVHAAEGRLVPDAQGVLEREYFYTDHLGNLRLVWKKGEELQYLSAESSRFNQ